MRRQLQPRVWTAAQLEAELGRVHAHEFARLLGRAALLGTGHRGGLAQWLDALGVERGDARWRGDARAAIRLAGRDGFEAPGLLRHCVGRELARWPGGLHLAEAARALGGGEGVRFHCMLACWLEGGAPGAGALAEFAATSVTPLWRARARRAQALALEHEGQARAALLLWKELAGEMPPDPRPWLEALLLAARLGDLRQCDELAPRLACLGAPAGAASAACVSAWARFRLDASPQALALVRARLPRMHPVWSLASAGRAAEGEE